MAKADKDRKKMAARARGAAAMLDRQRVEAGLDPVASKSSSQPRLIQGRKAYIPREPGLKVLGNRGKLDMRQIRTGERYGLLYRIASLEGEALIKSQLGDMGKAFGRGGGGSLTGLEPAAFSAQVRQELSLARWDGLRSQPTLIAVCDVICGKEWTPGQVTPDRFDQLQIETTLRIALDQLGDFWLEKPLQTIGIDAEGSGHFVQSVA